MKRSNQDHSHYKERSIPPVIVNWLRKFGRRITGMNGTTVIFFDKKSKQAMCGKLGHLAIRRFDDMMDAYVVISKDRVIAVGHRFPPLQRIK